MRSKLFWVGALACLWSGSAAADERIEALKRARPQAEVRVDKQDRLLSLRDPSAKAYPGSPKEAARAFLRDLGELAPQGLGEPIVRSVAGREFVLFPMLVHGVPLLEHGASVLVAPGNRPTAARFAPRKHKQTPENAAARVSPQEAEEIARLEVGDTPAAPPEANLVWASFGEEERLVYHARAFDGHDHWRILIDANSGAVLSRHSLRRSARARVFEVSPGLDGSIPTQEVELPEVLDAQNPGALVGEFASVANCPTDDIFALCDIGVLPSASGDFLFDPVLDPASPDFFGDSFAIPNAFFHVDRLHNFFARFGATDEEEQLSSPDGTCCHSLDNPLPVQLNLVEPSGLGTDNAFFTGSSLSFGAGTSRDFSYDAEVVAHEYGHAVTNFAIVSFSFNDELGTNFLPSAIGEGIADNFASLLFNNSKTGQFASGNANGFRDVDNTFRFPNDLVGESHADGAIFSGVVWEIKERTERELGLSQEQTRDLLTSLQLAALFGLPTPPDDFGDLALAMIDLAAELGAEEGLGSEFEEVVRDAFTSRGILLPDGSKEIRAIPLDEPHQTPSCARLVSNKDFCQFALGVRDSTSPQFFEFRPGLMQYKIRLAPKQVFKARIKVRDFFEVPFQYQILLQKNTPVTFTEVASTDPLFRFTFEFEAEQAIDVNEGGEHNLILENSSDEPQEMFIAFLVSKGSATRAFITIDQLDFGTSFTGGGCQSEPTRSLSWAPLAALLAGLYLARRRFARPS